MLDSSKQEDEGLRLLEELLKMTEPLPLPPAMSVRIDRVVGVHNDGLSTAFDHELEGLRVRDDMGLVVEDQLGQIAQRVVQQFQHEAGFTLVLHHQLQSLLIGLRHRAQLQLFGSVQLDVLCLSAADFKLEVSGMQPEELLYFELADPNAVVVSLTLLLHPIPLLRPLPQSQYRLEPLNLLQKGDLLTGDISEYTPNGLLVEQFVDYVSVLVFNKHYKVVFECYR
jgi:hypothetical protein